MTLGQGMGLRNFVLQKKPIFCMLKNPMPIFTFQYLISLPTVAHEISIGGEIRKQLTLQEHKGPTSRGERGRGRRSSNLNQLCGCCTTKVIHFLVTAVKLTAQPLPFKVQTVLSSFAEKRPTAITICVWVG